MPRPKKKRLMINKTIYEALKESARDGKPYYYGELAELVGLRIGDENDRAKLFEILGTISEHEHNEGRPLLSAIVISKTDKMPGYGFFKMARKLGLQRATNTEFFYAEVKKVFDYWKNREIK